MTSAPLGPGAEFDLIRRLTTGLPAPPDGVRLGPGDDAALLEGGWVLSTDLAIESVHFRRDWGDPEVWGGRAVRAALSDLAAMAAQPVGVFLSLAGRIEDRESGTLEAVGRGARATAGVLGAALLGGDVTRSPGPIVIDVVALGRTDRPLLRNAARPGHDLWVTGTLGGAAAAVRTLEEGREPDAILWDRFARPDPRLAEARWLANAGGVHAALDLSDGVAGDAGHIAAASDVAVVIEASAVPVDPAAEAAFGPEVAGRLALRGGEDYELLFTADPGFRSRAADFETDHEGVRMTRIGWVEAGQGVRLRTASGELVPLTGAFDHFAEEGESTP